MSRRLSPSWLLGAGSLALLLPIATGAELDFYRDVYPVLKANCISCHNKTTTKGGLNMESPELMKKGGETGPGAVAGKSAESLVVQAAAHSDPDLVMPPKNNKSGAVNLTAGEIDLLKTWIDQGAKHSVQQARQVAWQALPPGVNPIYTVAMTKDGRFAACGRANQIFIYDLATRQFVTRVADQGGVAHRALVQALAFSPDGTRLASGSFREVKIWRLEKGESPAGETKPAAPASEALLKQVTDAAKVGVLDHALSADGKQLVTGCADGSVRVWDAATAKPIIELRGSVAASKQIAALEWMIAAQGLEQSFQKAETTRIEAQNKALDELLKKANETIVAMKKALPEKEKAVKPAQEAKAAAQKALDDVADLIAKAPDGKPDAALVKQQKEAHEKLASTTMAETSAAAAFAAVESNIKDAEADVQRITGTKSKNDHDLAAASAATENSKKVQEKATADLAAAKQALTAPGAKPLAVTFSADGQKVAAFFEDGVLKVWAVASGIPIEQVEGAAAAKTTLTASADGSFTAAKAITLTTGATPRWVLERTLTGDAFADRVNAVRFSPDGKTLAVGGGEPSRSGDISLWDVANGKIVKSWPERHTDAVLSLDFSPDGKLLASGGADKIARVTDIASGKQVNLFEGHTHHVLGVAFRADGRVLASAGGDGVVLVWDMIIGERKKKIEGWSKEVTSLQFIGATPQIVTSAGDNLIRIVNDDGTVVRAMDKLPDFMQAAASTPSASVIIGGGEDSLLRVWDGTNGKELASFGAK
jgi:WD40 repeat protein